MVIGPEEPEKADRISQAILAHYGIAERTRWLGSRDDIPELLACCDIYTLPSWREGFPRSAIEAAAMGLPIVATDIRGCRQVVKDGTNGFLVPVRNIGLLGSAIKRLIADEDLRARMGRAGCEKARREFDEQKVCQIVLDTYRDC
jgi:glycosyltransferase involved in cell wall biosynthesis